VTARVSVILPAYRSQETAAACLTALREQTFRDYEAIVVDSSPDDETATVVAAYPEVRLARPGERLLPHAARNLGVAETSGPLLVFSDPDAYPRRDWLAHLVTAHERTAAVVVGAVACYGRRWRDRGAHLTKYDMWLPGQPPGAVALGPTVNLLCPRAAFERVGGFPGEWMIGDAVFSWRLTRSGYRLHFAPDAVVEHHHLTSARELARERFARGRELARLRRSEGHWSSRPGLRPAAVAALPLRFLKLMARSARHALRAGALADLAVGWPLTALGHAAWLAGEGSELLGGERKSCASSR
jgi:GT2 family glycosyltransferase